MSFFLAEQGKHTFLLRFICLNASEVTEISVVMHVSD